MREEPGDEPGFFHKYRSKTVRYMKNKTKILTFFVLFFCGIAFAAWGMVLPPEGIIDGSVLILIAQVFILAASIWGFEVNFDIKSGRFQAGKKREDKVDE